MHAYHRRIPTGRLNDGLRSAQSAHPAPGGARILYGVQGAVDPPTITLFATVLLPTYLRYLERSLRERFELGPTPIELRVRRYQQEVDLLRFDAGWQSPGHGLKMVGAYTL